MQCKLQLSPKQLAIFESKTEITCVSAGWGSGKTAITSILAILHLLRGRNVIIISPTFRQLKDHSFAQCQRFLYDLGLNTLINTRDLRIKYKNKEIIFISGEAAETLRGYTSIATLIFDETAGLSEDCWKLAYSRMRDLKGQEKKVYIVGTAPPDENHWFVGMCRRDDVTFFSACARENPFVEKDYVDNLEKEFQFLPDDYIRRELYGELVFAGANHKSMFADLEITVGEIECVGEPVVAGLDIGGFGSDSTVMFIRKGLQVLGVETAGAMDDEGLKIWVLEMRRKWHFTILRYDCTGIAHLIKFVDMKGVNIYAINFGQAANDRFANMRAAMYAMFANFKRIYMKHDDFARHGRQMKTELQATKWKIDDSRKMYVIPKEEIKKVLGGRSPDRADAAALAFSSITPRRKDLPKNVASAVRGINGNL